MNTFFLSCYLKKSNALKTGEAPIYLRITVNKQIAAVSLQATILPNLWDSAKERSRAKHKSAIELNNYINSAKAKITTMYRELNIEDIPLKDINEDFIRKYELYLKTEKSCANNSAIKHLKIFKKIIRIALINDWLQKDPFGLLLLIGMF